MRDKVNAAMERALEAKDAPFNRMVRAATEEVFKLTEWLTLVAAISVVGAKLNSQIATITGSVLQTVLAAYLGVRFGQWVAHLFGGRTSFKTVLFVMVPTSTTAIVLMNILVSGLVKAAT